MHLGSLRDFITTEGQKLSLEILFQLQEILLKIIDKFLEHLMQVLEWCI